MRLVMRLVMVLAVALFLAAPAAAEGGDAPAHGDPAAAHAGGHGGGHHEAIDPKKLGLQLLNFGVLLFFLVKFGGGAVNKGLAARHQQLKADLAAAADARAAAEAKLARQEARLGALEQEIAGLRSSIKAEAEVEKARLLALAEERAARVKHETTFLLDQQVREAEILLRREAAEAGLAAAEAVLRGAIGAADQQRLLDTFVGDMNRSGAARPTTVPPGSAPPPTTNETPGSLA
jgi:F-type H+-transporting ATPase subunit b